MPLLEFQPRESNWISEDFYPEYIIGVKEPQEGRKTIIPQKGE